MRCARAMGALLGLGLWAGLAVAAEETVAKRPPFELELYYETQGTGPPLVLIHGSLMTAGLMNDYPALLAAGRRVITVELQGHGHTRDIARPLRYELLADDIAALLGHLGGRRCDARLAAGGLQAEAALLDDQAAVFHVEQPGVLGDSPGLGRGDAQLQPQRGGTRRHGLAGDVRRLAGRAEHVDQAHRPGDIGERPVGRLAEDHLGVRVDRDNPPAVPLHVGGHRVRRLVRGPAGADHGDGVVAGQDALDDGVGTGHPATLTREAGAKQVGKDGRP